MKHDLTKSRYDFHKYNAMGNDYIVIDPAHYAASLTEESIVLICDRNKGIGSDGILWGPFFDDDKKISLKIFNPDGSEAEKSGNGIRIFSQYLIDAGYVSDNRFSLQTLGGEVDVMSLDQNEKKFRVGMGQYTFHSEKIPVAGDHREVISEEANIDGEILKLTCLSVGNPHCVLICKDVTPQYVKEIGPKIETNKMFPNRVNVQIVQVLDRNNIKIEIWERGAGYTLSSGSSSCAAAIAANKLKLVDKDVKVHMQGGTVEVNIEADNYVYLTGTVKPVFRGYFHSDFQRELLGKCQD